MKRLFSLFLLFILPFSLLAYTPMRVVVIKGSKFKKFYGKPLSSLRVFRCEGNQPITIPFQWDEKDSKGRFIFQHPPGTLSAEDELLFMLRDAGRKGEKECRKNAIAEISIARKWDGRKSYVYLSCCNNKKFAGVTQDLIHVIDGGYVTRGENFIMRFFKSYQSVPGEYIFLKGDKEIHFMDKVKLRSSLRFFHFFHISRMENDFVTKWVGIIDGNVRAVLSMKNYTKMAFGIPAFPISANIEVFPNYIKFPVKVDIPIVPDSFHILLVDDFKNLYGWKVYSSCSDKPYVVKGTPEGTDKFTCDRWKWYALSGPDFSLWTISILPENFPVRIGFYLKDDKNYRSPPERFPGEVPGLGWDIESLKKIKNKVKEINLLIYHIFAPPYYPGLKEDILNDILGKLVIKVEYLPENIH